MVIVTDIFVTAEEIEHQADKHFNIAKASRMEDMPQTDGKIVSKLVVPIQLFDKTVRDWVPNKTSKRTLVKKHGPDTDKWIGQTEEFALVDQNVRGEMKKVIFVK